MLELTRDSLADEAGDYARLFLFRAKVIAAFGAKTGQTCAVDSEGEK